MNKKTRGILIFLTSFFAGISIFSFLFQTAVYADSLTFTAKTVSPHEILITLSEAGCSWTGPSETWRDAWTVYDPDTDIDPDVIPDHYYNVSVASDVYNINKITLTISDEIGTGKTPTVKYNRGEQYKLVDSLGVELSDAASAICTDGMPPKVVSVIKESGELLRIRFSEPVTEAEAETLSNYNFSGTAGISGNPVSARISEDGTEVVLGLQGADADILDELDYGKTIIVTVSNVKDMANNVIDDVINEGDDKGTYSEKGELYIQPSTATVGPNPSTVDLSVEYFPRAALSYGRIEFHLPSEFRATTADKFRWNIGGDTGGLALLSASHIFNSGRTVRFNEYTRPANASLELVLLDKIRPAEGIYTFSAVCDYDGSGSQPATDGTGDEICSITMIPDSTMPGISKIYSEGSETLESGTRTIMYIEFNEPLHKITRSITNVDNLIYELYNDNQKVTLTNKENSVDWLNDRTVKLTLPPINFTAGRTVRLYFKTDAIRDEAGNRIPQGFAASTVVTADTDAPVASLASLPAGNMTKIMLNFNEPLHNDTLRITNINNLLTSLTINGTPISTLSVNNSVVWDIKDPDHPTACIRIPETNFIDGNTITLNFKAGAVKDTNGNAVPMTEEVEERVNDTTKITGTVSLPAGRVAPSEGIWFKVGALSDTVPDVLCCTYILGGQSSATYVLPAYETDDYVVYATPSKDFYPETARNSFYIGAYNINADTTEGSVSNINMTLPDLTFSFDGSNAGKLMGATTDMKYSINGGNSYVNISTANPTLPVSSINHTDDIRIKYKDDFEVLNLQEKVIDIQPGPAAPNVTRDDNEDSVSGIDTTMEFCTDKDSTWRKYTGKSSLPNLTGNIELKVRKYATGTTMTGAVKTLSFKRTVSGDGGDSGSSGGGGGGGGFYNPMLYIPQLQTSSSSNLEIGALHVADKLYDDNIKDIEVSVPRGASEQYIAADGNLFAILTQINKSITFKGEKLTISMHPSSLKPEDLDKLGLGKRLKFNLRILKKADISDKLGAAMQKAETGFYAIEDTVFELKSEIIPADSGETGLIEFEKPVTVAIRLGVFDTYRNVDLEKIGAYRYNEMTGQWDFLGGIYDSIARSVKFRTDRSGIYVVMEYNKTFTDLEGNWAKKEIEKMAGRQIVKGKEDGSFGPNNPVTRAEFTAMLMRALDVVEKSKDASPFPDVWEGHWYLNDVKNASRMGIISGTEDGLFGADLKITREQIVVMLMRALKARGKDITIAEASVTEKLNAFADKDGISPYAREAMAFAAEKRIVSGIRSGMSTRINPKAYATRAEAVVFITRLLGQLK